MNTIEHIYRYPVKGFPGEQLPEVNLHANEGIIGDRTIALSSGAIPVNDFGAWTPCQAFQRMSTRPELTRFQIEANTSGVQLTSPNDHTYFINKNTSDLDFLDEILDTQVSVHRASHNRGFWDHKDAAVSIINLSTIEVIARIVGKPIDPLRFRANLYVRAEAWSEFHWIGRALKIQEATLNVIRPIDRCRTISVNVDTGKLDLNMPALLIRHFGHMFCGVYATVENSGKITSGTTFEVADKFSKAPIAEAAKQKTAPDLATWPRPALVVEIKPEAEGINSFWIKDTLDKIGSFAKYKPGQYIRLHNLSDTYTWRSYSVSAVRAGKLRITVKRDGGVGSHAVHALRKHDNLIITGPFGKATLNNASKAIHFVSSGIGITPIVAKLTALAQSGYTNPVQITHVARSSLALALWDDVMEAVKKLPNAELNLYLTEKGTFTEGAFTGRPNPQVIVNYAKQANADVHICGSAGFVNSIIHALEDASISNAKIFIDRFSSPDVETDMRAIPKTEPIKVTFVRTNITGYWKPEDGTLLDFAEARGALIPSHCRAGLCKTCVCNILQGSATRLVGQEGDDDKQTLLCSSIPKEPLTLDM